MHETSSTSSSTTASRQQTVFDRRAPAATCAPLSISRRGSRSLSLTQVSRYDAGVPMSSKLARAIQPRTLPGRAAISAG